MANFLNPFSSRQFLDANGNPYSNAQIFSYAAGTSTKITLTKDQAGTSNHTNPIRLNTKGEPADGAGAAQAMWQPAGQAIKLVLAPSNDTDPPASPISTWDNLAGINDTSVTLSEWIAGPTPTFVSSTSFTLVGDKTTDFHIGRRIKTTDSGGTDYGTITNSVYTTLTTVTVVLDSGSLDSGLSSVSYGINSTNGNGAVGTPYIQTLLNDLTEAAARITMGVDLAHVFNGRITLTSGTPVTTSDVTAATTIRLEPYKGSNAGVYNGTRWVPFTFGATSLAVPSTTNTMYDVFIIDSGGAVALEFLAWANDTTRTTALTTQNGILVKSGDATRRYIGSFRTTGVSGQTEDSLAKRYVWNYYGRVLKPMKVVEATNTWSYATATFRQANGSTANQLDFVIGYSEDMVFAEVGASCSGSNVTAAVGIGLDSTTTNSGIIYPEVDVLVGDGGAVGNHDLWAVYDGYPGVGRHTLVWLEKGGGSANTWVGDDGAATDYQSGIHGWLLG